ncbi:MAG: Nucleoside-diphosphate-sugar epimerase [Pseudonocardiales bacterium]|nr:Nucleoside-diphosphate-sugar epimerase [Pseudonocardiales bacterium]
MVTTAPARRRALVVGATGIAGQTASRQLIDQGWQVSGLSRRGGEQVAGVDAVTADLLDPDSLTTALAGTSPELVLITAWMKKDTEAENISINSATVRNVLAALESERTVKHVALLTGLKHYLGPFDNYATGVMADTPFHEEEPRLDSPNFYYAQEDELFASAASNGFTWSVHRSHTIFGFAVGNAMNMVLTLSVYATICKELGQPFIFPGSATQWNGVTDVTDADLLAEQMIWAGTHQEGADQAFNTANGDVFRWRWLWPQIAGLFEVEWEGFYGSPRPLVERMTGADEAWRRIAARHGLVEADVTRLASWWHSDSDLGRNIEAFTSMNKSRDAGFLNFRDTWLSFTSNVARYREARIIP